MGADGTGTSTPRRRRAGTEADKAERRAQVLRAAKATFAAQGFHATTIADVARAAGVSYGVVYWYFDSKEALFDAVMDAEADALRAAVLEALGASGVSDPDEALRPTIEAVLTHYGADRDAARLVTRAVSSSPFSGRFLSDLTVIVADAQRRGRIRPGPAHAIAFAHTALVAQFVQRRLHTDDGMTDDEAARFVVDLLLYGVQGPDAPPPLID